MAEIITPLIERAKKYQLKIARGDMLLENALVYIQIDAYIDGLADGNAKIK